MNPNDQQTQQPEPVVPKISNNSRVSLIVTPTPGAQRKIAIAVDLSDESAYAVRWAVENYLRPGDSVILLHVHQTSVLCGADWGFVNNQGVHSIDNNTHTDDLSASNAKNIAEPLEDARIPYKIHVVKDRDMKERLCLEVERLGLCAMIMGSRGIGGGAVRRSNIARLGSVSDYCVHHCICPVVVVRYPEECRNEDDVRSQVELHPVPEEDMEASDEHQDD